MNTYDIAYTNFDADRTEHPHGQRVVIGTSVVARTGLDAIREALRAKGVDEADIATARTLGSNKRLVIAGITFDARKNS